MAVIYCMNIQTVKRTADYETLRSHVSWERQMKADKYYHMEDRLRCICSEILLKYSLWKDRGFRGKIELGYNSYGKPCLKKMKDSAFNISHSGDWVVVAISQAEIGVDVEKIQQTHEDIAHRFFTPFENYYIEKGTLQERAARFTQIWALKESYIKYLGTGLSTPLESFTVDVEKGEVMHKGISVPAITAQSYVIERDYYLAICSQDEQVRKQVVEIHEIQEMDGIW